MKNIIKDNMRLEEQLSRIKEVMGLKEETQTISDIIFNASDWEDYLKAIEQQYGNIIPLYHATNEENAKIIEKDGFKFIHGKNYISFSSEPFIYFQLGKSDYVSDNRPILFRVNVPIDFLNNCEIDMDGVNIGKDDVKEYVKDIDVLPSDVSDAILYFIWNNFKLDGTEFIIYETDPDKNILKDLTPIRVKQETGK